MCRMYELSRRMSLAVDGLTFHLKIVLLNSQKHCFVVDIDDVTQGRKQSLCYVIPISISWIKIDLSYADWSNSEKLGFSVLSFFIISHDYTLCSLALSFHNGMGFTTAAFVLC